MIMVAGEQQDEDDDDEGVEVGIALHLDGSCSQSWRIMDDGRIPGFPAINSPGRVLRKSRTGIESYLVSRCRGRRQLPSLYELEVLWPTILETFSRRTTASKY